MKAALEAIGSALSDFGGRWFTMLACNLVAVVLSIPIFLVVVAGTATRHSITATTLLLLLAIAVLPNPLIAGVHYLAHELAHGDTAYLSDQWAGLKKYGGLALRAWVLSLLVSAVILGNIGIYTAWSNPLAPVFRIVWITVLLVWLCTHVYVYPLIIEQSVKRVILVYRNAFILVMSRPLFAAIAAIAWIGVLLTAGITGLALFVGLAIGACIQHNATSMLLLLHETQHPGKQANFS